jgi:lon-related putative ATP-dependent protease
LLQQYDPEFDELFKVMADFEDDIERTPESALDYAQLVGTQVRQESLRHFDKFAVARLIEHTTRLAGDRDKLSAHMQRISDLVRESSFWAQESGHEIVQAGDVNRAIEERRTRAGRLNDRMQESILKDTIFIDTTGERIGQINGLSVYQLGNVAFGKPSRITAGVRMGKGDVVDIERQVEMGGPIHSKGVLIISSFLAGRYATERPLSLSASIVFEQSYSGVEGDSASSTELYALLSALARAPIRQNLAVTGSINQFGQIQAIGGVNEKIEGFFDLCAARGLTGDQGVLIPLANVRHLMLRQEVVEAVDAGRFHIYPVEHVDQGIELLTGLRAGELEEDDGYPEDSINGRVVVRLEEIARKQREYSQTKTDQESPGSFV